MTLSTTGKIILSWIGHLSGLMSFLASLAIIYMILSDRKRRLAKANHRLMLGLSIFNCFQSAAFSMTTIPVPVDYDTYGNFGNSATCTAQGFFIILGLGVPMYNTSLSILYLLSIRHAMKPENFSSKVEPFMHIMSCLVPVSSAILGASLGIIKAGPTVCFISWGPKSVVWIWIGGATICTCFVICIYSMASICYTVITQRKRMRRYSFSSRRTRTRDSETRDTVMQAMLYAAAFLLTFIFPLTTFIYESIYEETAPFFIEVMGKIFYPLQGFWNFLLYTRPIVIRIRTEHPDKNLIGIMREVIFCAKKVRTRVQTPIQAHIDRIDGNTPSFSHVTRTSIDSNSPYVVSDISGSEETPGGKFNSSQRFGQIDTQAEVMDGCDITNDNSNLPQKYAPRGPKTDVDGPDDLGHTYNIAKGLENDKLPQTSSLYMEHNDLEAKSHPQPLEPSHVSDVCSLESQWNELEDSNMSQSSSSISNKMQGESEDKDNGSLV